VVTNSAHQPHVSAGCRLRDDLVTIIGTTIAPWMQFYQQAAIVDKGLKPRDYAYERLDVIVGSLFAVLIAGFITISCAATLHAHGRVSRRPRTRRSPCGRWQGLCLDFVRAWPAQCVAIFGCHSAPLNRLHHMRSVRWEASLSRDLKEAPIFSHLHCPHRCGCSHHSIADKVTGAGHDA